MKEYRLKDRDLQRKLDEISSGVFSKRLNDTADVWANNPNIVSIAWETGLGKQTLFKVWIPRSDIEEIPQYDPTKWNLWPGVEPPQDVPLRIEVREPDQDLDTPEPRFGKIRKKACACFDGNDWFHWPGRSFSSYISIGKGDVVRFRPWVGPDEEDK